MPNWRYINSCNSDGTYGPWIFLDTDKIINYDKLANKECVGIAQETMSMPHTSRWVERAKVLGNDSIKKGTAIATFVDGKYQSLAHGNHVAIYLYQDSNSIRVIDQWVFNHKKKLYQLPHERTIYTKPNGIVDRSNDAKSFSVIHTLP
jgi:hypothetical protein